MTAKDLEMISFEIKSLHDSEYNRLEDQYQKADKANNHMEALGCACKQVELSNYYFMIYDLLETIKGRLDK